MGPWLFSYLEVIQRESDANKKKRHDFVHFYQNIKNLQNIFIKCLFAQVNRILNIKQLLYHLLCIIIIYFTLLSNN